MELLLCYKQAIQTLVTGGWTCSEVSSLLSSRHLGERGISEGSVRRFCDMYNMCYHTALTGEQLDTVVFGAVESAENCYGRKTIHVF